MRPLLLLSALALVLAAPPARAHDLHHQVETHGATVITLVSGHDHPFAGQTWEIRPAGAEEPRWTGRTDEAGRIVFLPPAPGEYRCRAFSADGHGADFTFEVAGAEAPAGPDEPAEEPAVEPAATAEPPVPTAAPGPDRSSRIVLGAGILLALFGLGSLAAARRAR